MNQPPLRILLVDDHAVVRDGLAAVLGTDSGFEVSAAVGSIDEALQRLRQQPVDVLLLDLLLGSENALERLPELHALAPDTTMLMLSSAQDESLARQALRLGARGFLTKDIDGEALISAIKAAYRGELQLSGKLDARLVRGPDPAAAAGLSQRESDVLQLLAEGRSNAEIAERLGIGETTVKTHVGNLLAKLGVNDRTQAAVHAWRHGWVSNPAQGPGHRVP